MFCCDTEILVQRLLLCLFTIYIYPPKYLFKSPVHFWIRLFVFLNLSAKSCICVLDSSLLSDVCIANIFSQSMAGLFIFLTISFKGQMFLALIKSSFINCSSL